MLKKKEKCRGKVEYFMVEEKVPEIESHVSRSKSKNYSRGKKKKKLFRNSSDKESIGT